MHLSKTMAFTYPAQSAVFAWPQSLHMQDTNHIVWHPTKATSLQLLSKKYYIVSQRYDNLTHHYSDKDSNRCDKNIYKQVCCLLFWISD